MWVRCAFRLPGPDSLVRVRVPHSVRWYRVLMSVLRCWVPGFGLPMQIQSSRTGFRVRVFVSTVGSDVGFRSRVPNLEPGTRASDIGTRTSEINFGTQVANPKSITNTGTRIRNPNSARGIATLNSKPNCGTRTRDTNVQTEFGSRAA